MKLSSQLLILFIGLTIIPLVFVSLLTYNNTRRVITNQIMAQLVSIADIKKNQLGQIASSYLESAELVASRTYLRLNLETYNQNRSTTAIAAINQDIAEALAVSKEIISITVIDNQGRLVASTAVNYQPQLTLHSPITTIEKIFIDEQNNHRVLLGSPIKTNNTTIGFIEIVSKIDLFSTIVSDYSGLGRSGEVLMAQKNENGDALFLTPIRFDADAALKRIVKKDQLNVPSVHAVNGEEKSFVSGMVDYRGIPVLAVTRFIPSQGWGIVVKIDQEEVFQPLKNILLTFIVIIFITFIIVCAVATFVAHTITKPIIQLSQAAQKLAKGKFISLPLLNHYPNNEIGILAGTFAIMSARLKESYRNLEAKVRVRTQDMEKFKMAVDNASDQIIITDPEGIILHASKVTEKITGFKLKEIIGKKTGTKELWGGQMSKEFYQKMWQTIKIDKKTFVAEMMNRRKDRTPYYVLASISPVLDEKGKITYFVGIERDITKEKEIDKMKTEFVSVASHQLRTPLTAIRWYVEEIYNEELGKISKDQKDYLKQVLDSNERMIRLVNDLLNVSRLESGRLTVEPVPTDLEQLIEGVITESDIMAKARNCQLNFIKPKKKLPLIKIDPALIRQVVNNLISNTIKYSKTGGIRSRVRIELAQKGKNAMISVEDNGIGIPANLQHRVFEKFFRADNAVKLETQGTGLGLYISKTIVEACGGKIWFQSSSQGTIFTFTLPLSGSLRREGERGLA